MDDKIKVNKKTEIKSKKEKNLHEGHRQRLKDELLDKELDGELEHKILEVLLFYAIPRNDTNETAHRLINEFGSLNGVLNASREKLSAVKGVKGNTAYTIEFFRKVAKLYLRKEHAGQVFELNNSESLMEYCKILFINAYDEQLRIIYLNDELNLTGDKLLGIGTPGKLNVPLRNIIEDSLKEKCNNVVITHNHPMGTCMPSNADVNYTYNLWQAFKTVDINLIDHIIVGKDGEWSMRTHATMPEIWGFK